MLLKMFGLTGAIALLAVSAAVAAPPAGKGKPSPTGTACKPKISVILKGALTVNGTADSVTLTVTGGNRFARAYRAAAQPVTVLLTTDTKIVRGDSHNAADLMIGDRVNVRARVCKADLALDAIPALTAVRVVAHPAKT